MHHLTSRVMLGAARSPPPTAAALLWARSPPRFRGRPAGSAGRYALASALGLGVPAWALLSTQDDDGRGDGACRRAAPDAGLLHALLQGGKGGLLSHPTAAGAADAAPAVSAVHALRDAFDGLADSVQTALRGAGGPPPSGSGHPSGLPGSPRSQPSEGQALVFKLLGVNLAVYAGWWVAPEHWMRSWFTTSAAHLVSGGRGALTALTSSFSHREVWHLGMNMLALMSFGPRVVDGRSSPQAVRGRGWEGGVGG